MKILVSGVENTQTEQFEIEGFSLEKSFALSSDRSNGKETVYTTNEDNLAHYVFEDGSEWFGYAGDVSEIQLKILKRGVESHDLYISHVIESSGDRGNVGKLVIRFFNIFTKKPATIAADKLAQWVDQKVCPNPGLYVLNQTFNLTTFNADSLDKTKKYLLLLHGTLNTTLGSFEDLPANGWTEIYKMYEGRVLAFDHYTISKSPIENAVELLGQLPANMEIDILSASRGGIIAEVLCRCDHRNPTEKFGFTEVEIQLLSDYKEIMASMKSINILASTKSLITENVVRVACPATGTILLSERLDHFLNFLLMALGKALGGRLNVVYGFIKKFILEVINSGLSDPATMPGLWCMVPETEFQKVINNPFGEVSSRLYVVAGDALFGGTARSSITVLLTNLYYRDDNDFVVNTSAMKGGLARTGGSYYFLSKTKQTGHFNYYKNSDSLNAILFGLRNNPAMANSPYTVLKTTDTTRGVQISIEMKPYLKNNISGNKPILILLPGIMGSTLQHSGDGVWLDFLNIASGGLVDKLNIDNPDVLASGVIHKYYSRLGTHFEKQYDIYVMPFDWRKSVSEAGKQLSDKLQDFQRYKQPIKIVAHSMGGLVVRDVMKNHGTQWQSFIQKDKSQFVMLGTPWGGSYLIMEVLTGDSCRVKQLNVLDLKYSKKEILNTISKFPGIYELLPLDGRSFETQVFWKGIVDIIGNEKMALPKAEQLAHFATYKNSYANADFKPKDFDKVYYIAGQDTTVNDYYIKKSIFGGEKLKYSKTPEGDGSVTWDTGIPTNLHPENLYFSDVSHGNLANESAIFDVIEDLFKSGKSSKMSQSRPQFVRSGRGGQAAEYDYFVKEDLYGSEQEVTANIFNDGQSKVAKEDRGAIIQVSILNSDLRHSAYPVMVGHFMNDGIYSAERALDNYLSKRLSERHRIGFYPGDIGENSIVLLPNSRPQGALVIGLGRQDKLTHFNLMLSAKKMILEYAFFLRDHPRNEALTDTQKIGISSIIIGSSFAGLPLIDSIKAVVLAVQKANQEIKTLDIGLKEFTHIEFVDYYEDVAQQAYAILKQLELPKNQINIAVRGFKKGAGSRKRIQFNESSTWWHNLTTEVIKNKDGENTGLSYSSASGNARVEKNSTAADLKIVEQLNEKYSHEKVLNKQLSKTMFELLVPNDFKNTIRNQNHIIWKMDSYSAQFPWEMFYDYTNNSEPTFINTGLIRQLYVEEYRQNPILVSGLDALVIGDPDYSGTTFIQLQGAAQEARSVTDKLTKKGFNVNSLINSEGLKIIGELFNKNVKVLHIAAHGVYDDKNVGIVLGNDLYLNPGTIEQLPAIPEFIFINCCYSGTLTALNDTSTYMNRAKLASNIGPQLIRMGVKAVVATGWAVDDAAANLFANELYDNLLAGYEFGIATTNARHRCYMEYPQTNTWGAYQCYGDHYYKLVNENPEYASQKSYVLESQVIIDLENMLIRVKSEKVTIDYILSELNSIQENVTAASLETAKVVELYAFIYAELGEYERAIQLFDSLRVIEKATFSVGAIEQFCSLRGKQLIIDYKLNNKDSYLDKIKNLMSDLENLKFLGNTSERLSLIGSANKRAAYIVTGTSKNKYLKGMKDSFLEAYKVLRNANALKVDRIYPLTNYLTANFCLNKPLDFNEIMTETGIDGYVDIEQMLLSEIKTLQKESSNFDEYYHRNAVAKLYLCLCLFDKPDSTKYHQDFKTNLMDSIDQFANTKHIIGEAEHLEFLIEFVSDATLKNLLKDLEATLKKLI